jgi:hypothetical protein
MFGVRAVTAREGHQAVLIHSTVCLRRVRGLPAVDQPVDDGVECSTVGQRPQEPLVDTPAYYAS